MEKPKCPKCGTSDAIPVIYGLPTPEAEERAQRGELILGGCCVHEGHDPEWFCESCENKWSETQSKREA